MHNQESRYGSRYPTTSIDRRGEYYERAAPVIAADPLGFYVRAEHGRKWLAEAANRAEYEREQMLDASPVEPMYEH